MKKSFCALLIFTMGILLPGGDIVMRPGQLFMGTEVFFQFNPPQPVGAGYHWDFGDGNTMDTPNNECQHTFNEPGSYRVTCTISMPGTVQEQGEIMVTIVDNRRISAQGSNFRQGKKVNFQTDNFIGNSLKWDFGDGTVESGPRNHGHVFQNQGNYTVKANDLNGDDPTAITCQVMIEMDNRRLEALPRVPRTNEKVAFTAQNFPGGGLCWDFGDGKVINGRASMNHFFRQAGNFQVRIWDSSESPDSAVSLSLVVVPDNRRLVVAPSPPRANLAANFTAANFSGPELKWDFGEGKVENGGTVTSHVYSTPGNFQVRVWEARDEQDSALNSTVAVQPDVRQIVITSPAEIFEGTEVDFEGRNFASASLKWNFGDGSAEERGMATQSHSFLRPGSFLVKAVEADTINLPQEKRIQVLNDNRNLVLKSNMVFANSEFEIEAQNFRSESVSWDFGDGPLQTGRRLMKHRYARPGQFRVRAIDFSGRDGKTFEKSIGVENDTRAISLPGTIIVGEAVAMQLLNVRSGNFTWKFSDGESRSGQELRGKAFRSPGPYTITVSDASGQYPPLGKTIQVLPDTRALKSSAGFILPKEEVSFTAHNFTGPGVRWDFGDGTVKESGQASEKHVYTSLGRYQVKAVDFDGRSSKVFTRDIVVAEMTPGFEVDSLEFAFDNGKYYQVLAKNTPSPGYHLHVRAKGRGMLNGQFILDGSSIGLFQLSIHENQAALLPEGQLVALPVVDLGLHEMIVKFNNYSYGKRIPIIKYFVSAAGVIQVAAPTIGAKVPGGEKINLRWAIEGQNPLFEIAISEVPFQFLDDKQISWQPLGESFNYLLDPKPFKPGSWIYWQVRLLDRNGEVQTTSEIASFRLEK